MSRNSSVGRFSGIDFLVWLAIRSYWLYIGEGSHPHLRLHAAGAHGG
jgi:hypothetical protein